MLVTGTPGTGKSSLCASIVDALAVDGYKHVEVGRVVKEHGLHEGRDEVCVTTNERSVYHEEEKEGGRDHDEYMCTDTSCVCIYVCVCVRISVWLRRSSIR